MGLRVAGCGLRVAGCGFRFRFRFGFVFGFGFGLCASGCLFLRCFSSTSSAHPGSETPRCSRPTLGAAVGVLGAAVGVGGGVAVGVGVGIGKG